MQPPAGGGDALTIQQVVGGRMVRAFFQPVIHLDSGEVVGYEALARGPVGTAFESPGPMFAAAGAAGLAWELDLVAHAAAFKAAVEAKVHPSAALFINVATPSASGPVPEDLMGALALARARLRVFMEMSERSLSENAEATMLGIERARTAGWGIALDNVGVTAASLALMPFAYPDVVKIDVSLVHEQTHPYAPRVMSTVTAHAERSGASIMAVGIESEAHARTARGLGAVLGQGYHFGRPLPLTEQLVPREPQHQIHLIAQRPAVSGKTTPFTLATQDRPPLSVADQVLATLAGHLEQRAGLDPDPMVVLACLPKNQMISGEPLAILQNMARNASFIGALIGQLPPAAIPDVHLVRLDDNEPMRRELTLILLGPHYSALLTARRQASVTERGGYAYRLVYDRLTVEQAAGVILRRINKASLT
ncbi:MAG TPA: EAL domain-containing protein [Rugosimonospora sp.]|nr:EAL domain-containing protein [Rugosimonospora sp.]